MNKTLKQMYHSKLNINQTNYDFRIWKVQTLGGKVIDFNDNYRLTIISSNGKEWIELKYRTMKALNEALYTMVKPYIKTKVCRQAA